MSLTHQEHQKELINTIVADISSGTFGATTVSLPQNYAADPRLCLTSVHLPDKDLVNKIQTEIITKLQQIEPEHHYYGDNDLHMTIKNIRVINDPPHFSKKDLEIASQVFSKVVPNHHAFEVLFFRLVIFPGSISLVGTTQPELDEIIFDLDTELKNAGLPDDKKYANDKYFFINMNLARFVHQPGDEFIKAVLDLSENIVFDPYTVDSVTLLTANAVLKNKKIIKTWSLKPQ